MEYAIASKEIVVLVRHCWQINLGSSVVVWILYHPELKIISNVNFFFFFFNQQRKYYPCSTHHSQFKIGSKKSVVLGCR